MSKFLNTVFGIIGAMIVGLIIGLDIAGVYIGTCMNESNEIEDEYAAVILKYAREFGKRLFYR